MTVDVLKFAQDNIFLIAIALISGGMLVWPTLRRGSTGPAVSTHQATIMMNKEDAIVVDVRDAKDFDSGHILNAKNIPMAQLEERLRELEKHKNKPLIVQCDTGNRSAGAAARLRKQGFQHVYTLSGGLAAWRQAGLPVAKG